MATVEDFSMAVLTVNFDLDLWKLVKFGAEAEHLCQLQSFITRKAQLTPWLARDSAATWRISLKFFFAATIEALTCAAT